MSLSIFIWSVHLNNFSFFQFLLLIYVMEIPNLFLIYHHMLMHHFATILIFSFTLFLFECMWYLPLCIWNRVMWSWNYFISRKGAGKYSHTVYIYHHQTWLSVENCSHCCLFLKHKYWTCLSLLTLNLILLDQKSLFFTTSIEPSKTYFWLTIFNFSSWYP